MKRCDTCHKKLCIADQTKSTFNRLYLTVKLFIHSWHKILFVRAAKSTSLKKQENNKKAHLPLTYWKSAKIV